MTIKERELLFKLNELVTKASNPPPTTFTAATGEVQKPAEYQSPITPLPLIPLEQPKG